jgi:hypothetical protein
MIGSDLGWTHLICQTTPDLATIRLTCCADFLSFQIELLLARRGRIHCYCKFSLERPHFPERNKNTTTLCLETEAFKIPHKKMGHSTQKTHTTQLQALEQNIKDLHQIDSQDGHAGDRYQQLKLLEFERNKILLADEALWRQQK